MQAILFFLLFCLGVRGQPREITDSHIADLEAEVGKVGSEILNEDLVEIKYLYETLKTLKEEEKTAEAITLERRIARKIDIMQHDMTLPQRFPRDGDVDRRIPGDIHGDLQNRMREREDMMRARFDRDREAVLNDRRGYDPKATSVHGDIPEDLHQRFRRHSPEDLNGVHKDIAERHQELITHRQNDLTNRIESAGFNREEEAEVKELLEKYLLLETEVMSSRKADKSPDRHAKFRHQSKEERLQDREAMKERRNQEKLKMEEAREIRKNIDTRIREKLSMNRDLL